MRFSKCLFVSAKEAFTTITIKDVLSKDNKDACINKLRLMKPIDARKEKLERAKNAAVLVPLCIADGQPSLLYIVRSRELKVNGGQVAFPGGMKDESDLDLKETALRETFEEIGLPKSFVDVWANGPVLGRGDLLITPYLGFVGEVKTNKFKLNQSEVSKMFTMSLEELCDPRHFRTTQFRTKGFVGYKLPVYLGGPEKIWGVTAIITHMILMALIPNFYHHKVRYQPSISVGSRGSKGLKGS